MELEEKDFSLRDVCLQVLASLRVNAQGKGLPLVLDYPDDQPEFFRGDALRIQQVLLNLVGNAIKFTEQGEVRLTMRHENGLVCLTVIDTGIGIAADRVERIFDPFAQADASMTRRFGGTGLGTTIARQLVELMQGRIWVESEPGVGSRFHVDLQLPEGDVVSPLQEQVTVSLPPLTLLVADDVPQNLELLQVMLSRLGHTLTTATNGEEAVQAFVDGKFDAVLMDVQMPVLNGLDATRQIRLLETAGGRAPTPVIALTASVLEEDVQAARDAGMDGFATKPVDLYALTLEIARLLDIPVSASVPAAPAPVVVRGSVIDWVQGQRLWGSEERHRDAIRRFLIDHGHAAAQLRTLVADPGALVAQAHRLRGAAGNLALSRVAAVAGLLEAFGKGAPTAEGEAPADPRALLDRLADELATVSETLGPVLSPPVVPPTGASGGGTAAEILPLLESADQALSHGELAEEALSALSALLPAEAFAPLDEAVNAFEFEAARQILSALRVQYCEETGS